MSSEPANEEVYLPMPIGLMWLFRCIWIIAAITGLSLWKAFGYRDLAQFAVLGTLGIAIIEFIFATSVYRRRQLIRIGIPAKAIVMRKYETSRGPVCKIIARYDFNSVSRDRVGTVSTANYHRLAIGDEFDILVKPGSGASWIIDARNRPVAGK